MKAALSVVVPAQVVPTKTLATPVPAGLSQVISIAETTTTLVAALAPKNTVAPLANPVPVIVTGVPPEAEP
jgi:hypothetical protein